MMTYKIYITVEFERIDMPRLYRRFTVNKKL